MNSNREEVSDAGHEARTATKFEDSRLALLSLVIALIVSLGLLSWSFLGRKTDFEDASTFGAETVSVWPSIDGHRIHCSDFRDADDCIKGVAARHSRAVALWLGNSQLHAVNQYHQGQRNASALLHESLRENDIDLIAFSEPNANFQEHYVAFEYLRTRLPIKVLLLPLVFDDVREDSLRSDIARFLTDERTRSELDKTVIGRRLIQLDGAKAAAQDADTAGIAHTMQEKVEGMISRWLEDHSNLWKARPEIRGQLMVDLYVLRNSTLGITPSTKRKVIRGRYATNLQALDALLESAQQNGVRVITYIAPIRNDVEIPYVTSEYKEFKNTVRDMATRHGATFANIEDLVPAKYWGMKDATTVGAKQELDFMHFQAQGHELLARQMFRLVTDIDRDSEKKP